MARLTFDLGALVADCFAVVAVVGAVGTFAAINRRNATGSILAEALAPASQELEAAESPAAAFSRSPTCSPRTRRPSPITCTSASNGWTPGGCW
jgi:hypothetical protein